MAESSQSGTFTILYFAAANSFTGKTQEKLPAPLEASKLFEFLEQRYTGIKKKVLSSCLLTVNQDYVDLDDDGGVERRNDSQQGGPKTIIRPGDEVAVIPPVSSG